MVKKKSASSRLKRRKASARVVRLNARQSAEVTALAKRSEAEIDTSDIPEVTDWSGAKVGKFYPKTQKLART